MLDQRHLDSFARDGLVIVEGLLDPQYIRSLYRTVASVMRAWRPGPPISVEGTAPFESDAFHSEMRRFRAETSTIFGAMYDTVQVSASLQQAMSSPAIVTAAAQLLGDEPESLSVTGQMLRMDAPEDRRNVLDWHQEASYYDQNERPENGLVCWVPMQDLQPGHGSMWFCSGSHRDGPAPVEARPKETYESSEQLRVPASIVARYQTIQVLCRAGDVVFFHMHLIHQSGRNVSSDFRFTAGARFHRMLTGDFLPGRLTYTPNTTVQKMRAEERRS